MVDCCLTWSLALIDLRACRTPSDLQDQLGKGS
ncbi:acetyltransferase, partial [Micromonospora craterilacus]